MSNTSLAILSRYQRPIPSGDIATYFEEQKDLATQRIRDTLDYQYQPSFEPIVRHYFKACRSSAPAPTLLQPSLEMKEHFDEGEMMVRWMRQHALMHASHRPYSNIRVTVALDALYLGATLGAYAGLLTGKCFVDGMFYLPLQCYLVAKTMLGAVACVLAGPLHIIAFCLEPVRRLWSGEALGRGQPTDASALPQTPAPEAHSWSAAVVRGLIAGTQAVQGAIQLTTCLVFGMALGAGVAVAAFSFRLTCMLTMFSNPFSVAVQGLNAWLGLEHDSPLGQIAHWTEGNERMFEQMRFSMGHHIEAYRRDLLLSTEWDIFAQTLRQTTTKIQSYGCENQKPDTLDHAVAAQITKTIKEWSHHLVTILPRMGERYRTTCINEFHFDPAVPPSQLPPVAEQAYPSATDELSQIERLKRDFTNGWSDITRPSNKRWLLKEYGPVSSYEFLAEEARASAQSTSLFGQGHERFAQSIQLSKALAGLIALPVDTKLGRNRDKSVLRQQAVTLISKAVLAFGRGGGDPNRQLRKLTEVVASASGLTEQHRPHITDNIWDLFQ